MLSTYRCDTGWQLPQQKNAQGLEAVCSQVTLIPHQVTTRQQNSCNSSTSRHLVWPASYISQCPGSYTHHWLTHLASWQCHSWSPWQTWLQRHMAAIFHTFGKPQALEWNHSRTEISDCCETYFRPREIDIPANLLAAHAHTHTAMLS